ncbi:MAG: hypothetical protein ABI551_10685 [Polyangiaceae bacterium]
MGSWVGMLVKMGAEAWPILGKHGVEATSSRVVPWIYVDCAGAFGEIEAFGETLSRALGSECIAFSAQSSADAYGVWHFDRGERLRVLTYSGDHGGWSKNEGAQQSWEAAFFFDPRGSTADDVACWPAMLGDELSPEDVARYEAAKTKGDPRPVMDLLHPSSLRDVERLCAFYDCDARKIDGTWRPVKKGFFASLFG